MFDAGGVWVSPNVLSFLGWEDIYALVERHTKGDYGEADEAQKAFNKEKLERNMRRGRVRSIYNVDGWHILVSTKPGEYTNVAFEAERFKWKNI